MNQRVFRISWLQAIGLLLYLILATALRAQFVQPELYDREYQLDLLTMSFEPDWNRAWTSTDNALAVKTGGLSERYLYLDARYKLRRDLTPGLRFRTMYTRVEDFGGSQNLLRLGIDALVHRSRQPWFLSLSVDPSFQKRAIDFGVALQRWEDPANRLELGLEAIDLLNNRVGPYLATDQGWYGTYVAQPYRARLAYYHDHDLGFRVRLDGTRFIRGSREEIRYGLGRAPGITEYRFERSIAGELAYAFSKVFSIGIEFERETREKERRPLDAEEPAVGDSACLQETHFDYRLRPYYLRWLDVRRQILLGIELATSEYGRGIPDAFEYHKDVQLPFLILRRWLSPHVTSEWGLLRENHTITIGGVQTKGSDNRLHLGLDIDINAKAALRVGTGLDLDRSDRHEGHIYDKAFLNLLIRTD